MEAHTAPPPWFPKEGEEFDLDELVTMGGKMAALEKNTTVETDATPPAWFPEEGAEFDLDEIIDIVLDEEELDQRPSELSALGPVPTKDSTSYAYGAT